MDPDQQIIKEYFEKLPTEVQELILESNWQNKLQKIAGVYNLNDTEKNTLENEVLFLLIDFQDVKEFETNIKQSLSRVGYNSQSLIKEIQNQIINPIKNISLTGDDASMKKNISKSYDSLPPLVQQMIDDSKWQDTIRIIGEKYKLHLDQGMLLENETLLVMLGLSPSNEFIPNIIENANIPKDIAENIGRDIEEGVFKEIRELLIKKTETKAPEPENIPLNTSSTPISPSTSAPIPPPSAVQEKPLPQVPDLLQRKINTVTATSAEKIDLSEKKPTHLDPYREPIE